ncbi:MAG: ABC transporter permease subunit [Burkholderiaceae bacterium]|nr:ABC transporter permease subunit [Burkholderiaceae bacterium]
MKSAAKRLGNAYLGLVFLFLYVPTASVVVYSFNESQLVNIWSGFSVKWYRALATDSEVLDAAWASLKIAVATACAAVFVGTWAGFVLNRYRRFRGLTLYTAMINAPLVIPEVIQGMSLLLLFVALEEATGWPQRGMFTIWIGHTMLCVSYVAITVQSRLACLDESLHEAAQILGATPLRVFFDITLPLIAQALVSGWLLSFTISIDDVLMTAFLQGPDSTLLPIVVFSRARLGLNPEINALGTLFIVVVTVGVLAGNHWMLRQQRLRDREMSMARQQASDPTWSPQ